MGLFGGLRDKRRRRAMSSTSVPRKGPDALSGGHRRFERDLSDKSDLDGSAGDASERRVAARRSSERRVADRFTSDRLTS